MQTPSSTCPRCQSPIPADAPGSLCPSCALLGVAEPTDPAQSAAAGTPTLEELAAAFPEYEMLGVIGQGGMGVVFKARQPRLDRLVALKILPPALAAQPGFAERFTREARALARLAHPHIVAVYDFGERAGFYYLMMEFVNGVNLRQAMRAGVTPVQALALVPRICEALQFAHDHGVLHRDIKPENILLDTAGTPKLADFGIAKFAGDATAKTNLTETGAALGTAAYMSPEQIEKPATVDHRADIYSLGVVLYEMLTGELPLGRFAAPSEKSTVGSGVDEVVMRSLEKERERRQQSAGEMKTQVENASAQSASPAPALKSSASYVCSPEHRFSLRGNFYIYTSKGRLALDGATLIFLSDAEQLHIPLRAIREIGIGHYSAIAKPIRLDFFSVVWDEAGTVHTRLFTPHESPLSPAWETNNVVAEWAAAVRAAAGRVQGREPSFVPSGALHTRKPSMRHLVALAAGIPMMVIVPLLFFKLSMRVQVWPALAAGAFGCFAVLMIARAFLRPKTPLSTIPQSANGPDRNPWPKRVFLLIVGLVVVPLMLAVVGLVVPMLARRSPPALAASAEVRRANQSRLDELKAAQAAAQLDVSGLQDEAIRLARARLMETQQRVDAGAATQLEQTAAELALAAAEARGNKAQVAEIRDEEVKVAEAIVASAEAQCAAVQARVGTGTASASQALDAELALNTARLALEESRRKSRAARAAGLEFPTPDKSTQP